MTECEKADIQRDMLELIEKENHAEQEQQVVVTRHHVLGTQVHKRQKINAAYLLDVALVTLGNTVRKNAGTEKKKKTQPDQQLASVGPPRDRRGETGPCIRQMHKKTPMMIV